MANPNVLLTGSVPQTLQCDNFIGGKFVPPINGKYQGIHCPADATSTGKVALSDQADVDAAVKAAKEAFPAWAATPIKARCIIMQKLAALYMEHEAELVDAVKKENGKNTHEARGSVQKGNETVMYAAGLPPVAAGKILEVSHGVWCEEVREPVGIIGTTCPFNFPFMVPMWTTPIALALGNCVILKPSEKVPICSQYHAEIMKRAGVPDGVFQIVNGMRPVVEGMIDHPDIDAITFVGSTPVAKIVYDRAHSMGKRCISLGGAKNHMMAFPDADFDMTSTDVCNSSFGTSGQRCMAASVLTLIGENKELLDMVCKKASAFEPGQDPGQIGPVIDQAAETRIVNYIDEAEKAGAKVLVDGRGWAKRKGFWVGPTVVVVPHKDFAIFREEIFGPVLTVLQVKDKEEAMVLQNESNFGNAACVYTSSGQNARWCTGRFTSGMIGVNIGVPVPREPFAFGGRKDSKFGISDISGDGALEFFSQRKKITTKWVPPAVRTWMD